MLLLRTVQSIPSLMHRYRAVHFVRGWERNVLKDAHSESKCDRAGPRATLCDIFVLTVTVNSLRTSKVAPSLVRRLIARRRFTVELIRLQEGKVSDETVGHTVVMWSPFTFRVGC